jgi:hypothetical protein
MQAPVSLSEALKTSRQAYEDMLRKRFLSTHPAVISYINEQLCSFNLNRILATEDDEPSLIISLQEMLCADEIKALNISFEELDSLLKDDDDASFLDMYRYQGWTVYYYSAYDNEAIVFELNNVKECEND